VNWKHSCWHFPKKNEWWLIIWELEAVERTFNASNLPKFWRHCEFYQANVKSFHHRLAKLIISSYESMPGFGLRVRGGKGK